jgi:hypothetical protein
MTEPQVWNIRIRYGKSHLFKFSRPVLYEFLENQFSSDTANFLVFGGCFASFRINFVATHRQYMKFRR